MANIVVGMGTGRSGTHSLADLLNGHPDIKATHEKCGLGWVEDLAIPIKAITTMSNACSEAIVADVGFYWLDYVDSILEVHLGAKFICLKRDKEDVVNSYMRTGSFAMHHRLMEGAFGRDLYRLCDHVTQEELDNMDKATKDWVEATWKLAVPYDIIDNTPEGIKNRREWFSYYWEEYNKDAEKWQEKYPDSFVVYDMLIALNTEEGRHKLFNFIGIVPDKESLTRQYNRRY